MINVEINGKLVGQCESAGKASSPLFKDVIEPWIEIRGFIASSPSLTDDQQVVLESLKHYYSKSNYYDIRAGKEPMQAVDRMLMEAESDTTGLSDVYYRLTEKQQFQVLAAFAEWGLSTLDN